MEIYQDHQYISTVLLLQELTLQSDLDMYVHNDTHTMLVTAVLFQRAKDWRRKRAKQTMVPSDSALAWSCGEQ